MSKAIKQIADEIGLSKAKELTAALENMTASLKATLALHIGTMQQNLLTKRVKVKLIE